MAAAQADRDGTVEVHRSALQNDFVEQIGRRAGRGAIEHLAEDDAAHAVEFAGVAQLPQHAIDLIGLRADVFEEEKLAFGRGLPRRAEQRNENAEASAVERAAAPRRASACAGLRWRPRCRARRRARLESWQVDAIFEIEIRGHHGTVKRRQAESDRADATGCR